MYDEYDEHKYDEHKYDEYDEYNCSSLHHRSYSEFYSSMMSISHCMIYDEHKYDEYNCSSCMMSIITPILVTSW